MSPKFYLYRAWFVHFYTGSTLPLSLLSLIAITHHQIQWAFILNGINVLIDSSDGTLARKFEVKKWIPDFDGAKLDDIADFLTYVIVPMFLAYHLKMVPSSYLWTLGFPVLASGYGFCQGQAKTTDGFFTGFPSYWNILVLYFYLLETPPLFNAWAFLVCSLLVFIPIKFLYPSRARYGKKYLLSLGLLWACCLGYMLYQMKETPPLFLYFSLLYPLYYTLYSLLLNRYTPTLPQEETPPS